MSFFLLLACAAPIIYTFISVSAIITEIIGYRIVFDKQKGQLTLNSKIACSINEITKIYLNKREKKDNFKEWIKYKLLVKTTHSKTIVLAISKKKEVLVKLAKAISIFLEIDLTTNLNLKETTEYTKTRAYENIN